jgi:hypothetical protein
VLGPYPENNGNSGILSLYDPPVKDAHMIAEESENCKIDHVLWETNDQGDGQPSKGGIKYIDIKEFNLPIAWHVTTLERLNEIYVALTQNPPLDTSAHDLRIEESKQNYEKYQEWAKNNSIKE